MSQSIVTYLQVRAMGVGKMCLVHLGASMSSNVCNSY